MPRYLVTVGWIVEINEEDAELVCMSPLDTTETVLEQKVAGGYMLIENHPGTKRGDAFERFSEQLDRPHCLTSTVKRID